MESKPRRILYLIWSLDLGGAETVVLHLAQGLNRERFSPLVGCLHEKGRFATCLEKAGIPVVAFLKRPKLDPTLIPRIRHFLEVQSIDLIHAHLFTANLWGRVACVGMKMPVVVTEHNVDTWKGGFHLALDLLLKPLTSHWIFVSEQVRHFYEGRVGYLKNASVIYNGVPLSPSLPGSVEARQVTLAAVGRLAKVKGLHHFVELIAALHQEGLPIRGLLVGDGAQRQEIAQMVAREGLQEVMELTGFVSQMEKIWPRIDILCLTSSREGLPMSVLEAMSYGIPVVATDVGGVRECLQNGQQGYLVSYGDWKGFRDRIRELVRDPSLRRRLGQAGRIRVESQFGLRRMVEEHERLYERLLKA